jgi:hypothetical protein
VEHNACLLSITCINESYIEQNIGGGSLDNLLHFFCDIVTMTRCFASPLRQSKINAKKCCTTVLNRTSCCLQVGSNLPWINSNTLNRWWELYCAVIMLETYNVKISAMPLHVRPMLGAKLSLCLHGQKISWQRGFVSFLKREITIVSRVLMIYIQFHTTRCIALLHFYLSHALLNHFISKFTDYLIYK